MKRVVNRSRPLKLDLVLLTLPDGFNKQLIPSPPYERKSPPPSIWIVGRGVFLFSSSPSSGWPHRQSPSAHWNITDQCSCVPVMQFQQSGCCWVWEKMWRVSNLSVNCGWHHIGMWKQNWLVEIYSNYNRSSCSSLEKLKLQRQIRRDPWLDDDGPDR